MRCVLLALPKHLATKTYSLGYHRDDFFAPWPATPTLLDTEAFFYRETLFLRFLEALKFHAVGAAYKLSLGCGCTNGFLRFPVATLAMFFAARGDW